jgi:hypothetical protein
VRFFAWNLSDRMRTLLIVSPHFVPINAPDMQRVRMSLIYFAEFGWKPGDGQVHGAAV